MDFDNSRLQKIVVSGLTDRIDDGDNEIYLPKGMDEMLDFEYIFHTHPPTPKPGGRAPDGILYEVPSISDIFHFIYHYNDGNVIGSLVVAPEGLYNIRRYDSSSKKELSNLERSKDKKSRKIKGKNNEIDIDEDGLYSGYAKIFRSVQKDSIKTYGDDFTNEEFYSTIAQDITFINRMNKVLNGYEINIDYYPRKKDGKYWYIDTVFLRIGE